MSQEGQSLVLNYSDYSSTSSEDLHKPPTPPTVFNVSQPNIRESIKIIIKCSWINYLLIFIPFGYLAHIFRWSDTWIFILNFLAILPLSKLYDFATVDASLRVGQSIGCLLNATFGNAVELIVTIIALTKGELRVVQASLLGAIISNLLLIIGMCFVIGGYYYHQQVFNQTIAQTSSGLITLACIGLVIPAAFNFAVNGDTMDESGDNSRQLLNLSHGTAIVLLIIYILYIYFQLKTHSNLYQVEEEEDEPQLTLSVILFLFVAVTIVAAFSAEYLVSSIEGMVESSGLSKTFVGLILLPIIGNAAEFTTAINAAMRNKMSFAITIAAGSSMQIALFITPFLVLLGWIIGQSLTLYFHSFETVVLFISVIITNYLILDGKSNWLEGVMLLATYTIISLAFFFYPND
ncbi:Sodium/calcium exchanger protein [Glomus cerebriforme]|uniref:Vacuolar calcium ion transporter n=1 Tax=Glomus cerebriforme TaxID=658196 RepID=A0A397T1X2_9GLOM|nr:Sodium/calcium exchanger protein [Glomus cerebriforme]